MTAMNATLRATRVHRSILPDIVRGCSAAKSAITREGAPNASQNRLARGPTA